METNKHTTNYAQDLSAKVLELCPKLALVQSSLENQKDFPDAVALTGAITHWHRF